MDEIPSCPDWQAGESAATCAPPPVAGPIMGAGLQEPVAAALVVLVLVVVAAALAR
jgi:hypothetical protein